MFSIKFYQFLSRKVIFVTVGSIYINGSGGQTVQAESLIINTLYYDKEAGYDIGLVKLRKSVNLG